MRDLDKLREKLMDELIQKSNEKGEITTQCLDVIYKLVESIKGIDKIYMLSEALEKDNGYSNTGKHYRGVNSYYNGYSRHGRKEKFIDELERMRETADNEHVRDAVETVIALARLGD